MKKVFFIGVILVCCVAVVFISCNKDNSTEAGTTALSTLQVRLTDAPTIFDEVKVDIREVKVKFSDDSTLTNGGWINLITYPGIYDLLALQNGVDTLLATGAFPTQIIKEIRFILGPNNTIKDAGIVYPLVIPGGSESGLKIKVNKKLQETLETIIIDFDAGLSVKKEGSGDYKLRPVLKIK